MRAGELYSGDSLKAEDLQGRSVRLEIASYKIQKFDDGAKAILSFTGKTKTFVVNKTNANIIAEVVGTDEMDDWIGKTIVLYPTKTEFQGKRVACIRVDDRPQPAPRGSAPKPPPAPEPSPDEFHATDDDVPF